MSKKNISIKKQLTLLYSTVIILVTAVLFITFYLLTSKYLIFETDRSLILHASQLVNTLIQTRENIHSSGTESILQDTHDEIPGMFVEVVDSSGLKADGSVSQFRPIALNATESRVYQFTTAPIGDFNMRIIADPIMIENVPYGVVLMGHPIDVYQNTLIQLKNVGFLLLIFLVVPSILIGYYLADSVIKPLYKLSSDINKITTENLSHDINVTSSSAETDLLVQNFNSLLKRINDAFKLERQFLGEMAHEIKTPLAVIKSNSEVILTKNRNPEEYRTSITQTLSQIDNLSNNMACLMDFAWSQTQNISKTFKKLDLSVITLELINVAKYMAKPKDIIVKSKIQPNLTVLGKEEKIYQAFYNIIDNAIKFTDNNGQISISLTEKGSTALIEISDSGVGIEPNKVPDIFKRFYRTEQNKNISGHGLGLAIADSIILAHNGSIKVQSKVGKGSTFVIALPLSS